MPTITKICCVCGEDVATKKRVKDPQGQYYCNPCYQSRGQNSAPAMPPEPLAAAMDDGMLDLAPAVEPERPKADEMFACAVCKKIVPKRQVKNIDGEFQCLGCVSKSKSAPKTAPSGVPARTGAAAAAVENQERWVDSLKGGLIISAAMIVLCFGLFSGFHMVMPGKEYGGGIGPALGIGVLYTVLLIFSAAALMGSMLITSMIMGGISFGFIGSALYKSLGLFLVVFIIEYFASRNESLFMLNLAFGGVIFLVGFIVLFQLDFMEAIVLSFINSAVKFGMMMLFAMLAVLLYAAASSSKPDRHAKPDPDDEEPEMVEPQGGADKPAPAIDPILE